MRTRAVKWLPAAMGMDPASPRCDRFYAALARCELPLITHAGLERAVLGADQQDLGDPLKLRRALDAGVRVLERADWHARLLNGSDYPLPGLMPIFSIEFIVSRGLLEPAAAPVLSEIRKHNPLLFNFVRKRSLRHGGKMLAARVFETRRFFEGRV